MYKQLNDENLSDETSTDADKTEMSDLSSAQISDSYGSIPAEDKSDSQFYVPCCGLVFYVMSFLGFFCALLLREGLTVAIVAMVNQTAVAEENVINVTEGQCPRQPESELQYESGVFDWNRKEQTIVLSAFYFGYELTQIPGGLMADRFGGKWLYGGCVLLSSVISLLTPTAARIDIGLLITLRVLSGLGEGVMFPAVNALIARWSAPKYHTIAVNAIFVGIDVGVLVGMFLAGVLCDYGFAGGWPSVFYVFGAVGCIWSIAWFLLCYNSPSTHPRISTAELKYWETMIGTTNLTTHPPTPWRKILTSVPVWALAVAGFANNWGYYIMVTCLPLYLYDVLGLNMTMIGVIGAVPFVAMAIAVPVCGLFADWLRSGRLSTNVVRKMFCVGGFTLSACFYILIGFTDCNVALAVATICIVITFIALGFSTVDTNQLDLAPLHAGKIAGLVYTIADLSLFTAPLVVGAFTYQQPTRSQWEKVFVLTAGIYGVGALVFLIFGSGDRQSWADDTTQDEVRDT